MSHPMTNAFNNLLIGPQQWTPAEYCAHVSWFNSAIKNSNPPLDHARRIAAEVRTRHPEMQVRRRVAKANNFDADQQTA